MKTPRPNTSDPNILRLAAQKLAPEVVEWMGDGTPPDDVIDDIVKAIRYNHDGYQIAKRMDDYEPDSALVEILESAYHYKSSAHNTACIEWVETEGLEPPPIGASAKHTTKPESGLGTITRNWPEGRSTVSFPTLGHVTEGCGCHGLILDWEKLEILNS